MQKHKRVRRQTAGLNSCQHRPSVWQHTELTRRAREAQFQASPTMRRCTGSCRPRSNDRSGNAGRWIGSSAASVVESLQSVATQQCGTAEQAGACVSFTSWHVPSSPAQSGDRWLRHTAGHSAMLRANEMESRPRIVICLWECCFLRAILGRRRRLVNLHPLPAATHHTESRLQMSQELARRNLGTSNPGQAVLGRGGEGNLR